MRKLINLVEQNPELPIFAMVNGDICHDYGMYWLGKITSAEVVYLGVVNERVYDEVEDFKEAYYNEHCEELEEKFNYNPLCTDYAVEQGKYTEEQFLANCEAEKQLEIYLAERAKEYMRRAIVVYVNEPDADDFKEV